MLRILNTATEDAPWGKQTLASMPNSNRKLLSPIYRFPCYFKRSLFLIMASSQRRDEVVMLLRTYTNICHWHGDLTKLWAQGSMFRGLEEGLSRWGKTLQMKNFQWQRPCPAINKRNCPNCTKEWPIYMWTVPIMYTTRLCKTSRADNHATLNPVVQPIKENRFEKNVWKCKHWRQRHILLVG